MPLILHRFYPAPNAGKLSEYSFRWVITKI